MGVDERRKGLSLLAKKMKARNVVRRGEKSLLGDPGLELRLGRGERERKRAKTIDGMINNYTYHSSQAGLKHFCRRVSTASDRLSARFLRRGVPPPSPETPGVGGSARSAP